MRRVLVQYLQDIANNNPSWELRCFFFIPRRENWDAFFSSLVRIEMPSFQPSWKLRCLLFIPWENWDAFFSSLGKIEMPSFHPLGKLRCLLFIPRENWDTFFSSPKRDYEIFIQALKGCGIIGPMKVQGGSRLPCVNK